jgi:hypothetical protein
MIKTNNDSFVFITNNFLTLKFFISKKFFLTILIYRALIENKILNSLGKKLFPFILVLFMNKNLVKLFLD